MTITRAPSLFLFGIFLLLLLLSTGRLDATTAAGSNRLEARFEVFGLAGLHVLTNRTTVEQSGDRYAIATDLDTRGLASVFVDLASHSQVSGRLGREVPHPERYRADVRRNGAERYYAVDFRSDGTVVDASTTPSFGPSSLSSEAKKMHGAVD